MTHRNSMPHGACIMVVTLLSIAKVPPGSNFKENYKHLKPVDAHCISLEMYSAVHNLIFHRADPDHMIVCRPVL